MLNRKLAIPRGILHVTGDDTSLGLTRFEPSAELAVFVEHYWEVVWQNQPTTLRETVPHPSVFLAIEHDRSTLGGVYQKRFSRMIEGDGRVLGVKFRPGGFKTFVNSSVCDLTNQVVLPETIFGQAFSKLEKNALATSDAAMAFELVDQFLIQRDPIGTPELDLVREIMTLIETDRSIKRADAIADQFSIGLRSLQRLFKQYVGVSPKWVIQRHRLIEAAERIRDGSSIQHQLRRSSFRSWLRRPTPFHPRFQNDGRNDASKLPSLNQKTLSPTLELSLTSKPQSDSRGI